MSNVLRLLVFKYKGIYRAILKFEGLNFVLTVTYCVVPFALKEPLIVVIRVQEYKKTRFHTEPTGPAPGNPITYKQGQKVLGQVLQIILFTAKLM